MPSRTPRGDQILENLGLRTKPTDSNFSLDSVLPTFNSKGLPNYPTGRDANPEDLPPGHPDQTTYRGKDSAFSQFIRNSICQLLDIVTFLSGVILIILAIYIGAKSTSRSLAQGTGSGSLFGSSDNSLGNRVANKVKPQRGIDRKVAREAQKLDIADKASISRVAKEPTKKEKVQAEGRAMDETKRLNAENAVPVAKARAKRAKINAARRTRKAKAAAKSARGANKGGRSV